MKRRVLTGLAVLLVALIAPKPAVAQNTIPLNCTNLPQTAELRILRGFAGKAVTLNAGGGIYPGCDNFVDTYTVIISWGDGSSSQAALSQNDQGRFTFSEQHVYAIPGRYPIVYTQTNNRTGVSRSDGHYLADISTDRLRQGEPLKARAGVRFEGEVVRFVPESFSPRDYVASISWGDGKRSGGTVVQVRRGGLSVRGSHTWKTDLGSKRNLVVTLKEETPFGLGPLTVIRPLKIGPPRP